jgi:hypothetical protein
MDEQGVLHTNFGSLCGRSAEAALDSRARACGDCLSLLTALVCSLPSASSLTSHIALLVALCGLPAHSSSIK